MWGCIFNFIANLWKNIPILFLVKKTLVQIAFLVLSHTLYLNWPREEKCVVNISARQCKYKYLNSEIPDLREKTMEHDWYVLKFNKK